MKNNTLKTLLESRKQAILKEINDNNDYEYYMSKNTVDEEYIEWLANEMSLTPETIASIAEMAGGDPEETYTMVDNEVNSKGYGFDKEEDHNEDRHILSRCYAFYVPTNELPKYHNGMSHMDGDRALRSLLKAIVSNHRMELDSVYDIFWTAEEDTLYILTDIKNPNELFELKNSILKYWENDYGNRFSEYKAILDNICIMESIDEVKGNRTYLESQKLIPVSSPSEELVDVDPYTPQSMAESKIVEAVVRVIKEKFDWLWDEEEMAKEYEKEIGGDIENANDDEEEYEFDISRYLEDNGEPLDTDLRY